MAKSGRAERNSIAKDEESDQHMMKLAKNCKEKTRKPSQEYDVAKPGMLSTATAESMIPET